MFDAQIRGDDTPAPEPEPDQPQRFHDGAASFVAAAVEPLYLSEDVRFAGGLPIAEWFYRSPDELLF